MELATATGVMLIPDPLFLLYLFHANILSSQK
jgi:hypothetical protein